MQGVRQSVCLPVRGFKGSIPAFQSPHVEVPLGKTLNPTLL